MGLSPGGRDPVWPGVISSATAAAPSQARNLLPRAGGRESSAGPARAGAQLLYFLCRKNQGPGHSSRPGGLLLYETLK